MYSLNGVHGAITTPSFKLKNEIMTPADKARELAYKMWIGNISVAQSWQLAGIVVQEIINANPHGNPLNSDGTSTMDYWLEVKKEIDKM